MLAHESGRIWAREWPANKGTADSARRRNGGALEAAWRRPGLRYPGGAVRGITLKK